jgi:hypothetical protein
MQNPRSPTDKFANESSLLKNGSDTETHFFPYVSLNIITSVYARTPTVEIYEISIFHK